jgi:hypothetical protein
LRRLGWFGRSWVVVLVADDGARATSYEGLNVSPSYTGTFEVRDDERPSPIREDTDGDGEVDNVQEPTSEETVTFSSAAESDAGGLGTTVQFVLFALILASGAGLALWLSRR